MRRFTQMLIFNYTIHHKPGKANAPTDHLSRFPMEEPDKFDEEESDVPFCVIEATAIPVELG